MVRSCDRSLSRSRKCVDNLLVLILQILKLQLLLMGFRMLVVQFSAPKTEFFFQSGHICDITRVAEFVLFIIELLFQLVISCFYFFEYRFVALF